MLWEEMVKRADVAVVGVGSMGSMALWQLASRGAVVVGFEQFTPGHDLGEGHAETRIIRSSYREGAEFVPLVQEAFRQWRQLEAESSCNLLTMNSAVMIGKANGEYLAGVRRTSEHMNLPHAVYSKQEAGLRYPQFVLDPDDAMVHDFEAGFLRPEMAILAAVDQAARKGAQLQANTKVCEILPRASHVEIRSSSESWQVEHVVVATGAWTDRLFPKLSAHVWVERQVMFWFKAVRPEDYSPLRFPVFTRELDAHSSLYGFPSIDGATMKMAFHHRGHRADPDALDREVHEDDWRDLGQIASAWFRDLDPQPARSKVCMYTNTNDNRFLIGPLPSSERVTLVGPMAGHGFKFAAGVGKVAADLALSGTTSIPIATFNPARFLS